MTCISRALWLLSALATTAAAALTGCVDPPMTNAQDTLSRSRATLPDRFEHAGEPNEAGERTPAIATDLAEWPNAYGDAQLEELVSLVLAANHDLEIAAARLREMGVALHVSSVPPRRRPLRCTARSG